MVRGTNGENRLENRRRKLEMEGVRMGDGGSMRILEREMHGAREAIPEEETYNPYGVGACEIEIVAIGNWNF